MVGDVVLLENFFSLGNEGLRSKNAYGALIRSLQTCEKSAPTTTTCVRSANLEANQLSLTDVETLLEDIEHDRMVS
jgi:hypothetical protein